MTSESHTDSTPNDAVRVDVRSLTAEQLGQLGVSHIAYLKPVILNGAHGFSIHAADGTPMAMAEDRDIAIAAIIRHEMFPVSVH